MTDEPLTPEQSERLLARNLLLNELLDIPRLQGGVLTIAHDVHPALPFGEPRLFVLRHERRGRIREAQHRDGVEALKLLLETPYRDRVPDSADPVEALKV